MSDLPARLRANAECDIITAPKELLTAAADRIEALAAEVERLGNERNDALEQVEELERSAEVVSDEFEKDCWKAMRLLLECCKFDWRDVDPHEGVTADSAYEYIKETIDCVESDAERAKARAESAERALADYTRHEQTLRDNGIPSHSHAVVMICDLRRALAEAIEIMRPFADKCDDLEHFMSRASKTSSIETFLYVGDLRAARDFITAHEKEKGNV